MASESLPTPYFETLVRSTIKHLEELADAATVKLVGHFCKRFVLILLVFFLGSLLLYARNAIFWIIPLLIEFVYPLTLTLDAFLTYLSAESFVLSESWLIFTEVVNKVTIGASKLEPIGAPPTFHIYKFKPSEVKRALNDFASTCSGYDTVGTILGRSIKTFLGPYICPVLRYVYPVEWLFAGANAVLGWASPDPTPAGFNGENNCASDPQSFSWVCAVVGTGYAILEVLLPLFIVLIFLEVTLVPTVRVLFDIIRWHSYVGSLGLNVIVDMLILADRAVENAARRLAGESPDDFKSHNE